MIKVYLCLGSNVGDRYQNMQRAINLIKKLPRSKFIKASHVYEASPVGPRQKNFLNAVVIIQTKLEPLELLQCVKSIEKELRRKKTYRWGPRTMDVDILLYGDGIFRHPDLIIPHPDVHQRRFALVPFVEIAPRERHPILKKTMKQVLDDLTDDSQRVKLYV